MAFPSLEGIQYLFIIHLYGIIQCMDKYLENTGTWDRLFNSTSVNKIIKTNQSFLIRP